MNTIPFNIPLVIGKELQYIQEVLEKRKICGDGDFTKRCNALLESLTGAKKALLTTSCTHALEMAAILADIKSGDEVIMPSYTFVSTANAFVLRGAKIVFVDVRPDTMNMDENLIEAAITSKTKAIVPVHYAGVGCEMDKIMNLANKYHLLVIEDAAQALMAAYKGKALGTFGTLGCLSFHETKNYQCGEGGALLINDSSFIERAEIIREKGTNRSKFFRGQVDKYSWVDVGSSYLPSELNAAFLYAQLENADLIKKRRLELWNTYYCALDPLRKKGFIELPFIPEHCEQNGHMFYIKIKDVKKRQQLIDHLKTKNILSVFHYIPLHSSAAGETFGRFQGQDNYTTKESERLLRLPFFLELMSEDINRITGIINGVLQ
jgi:dTDP-4-amino-4,6-dideoxygalactose transaminase